MPITNEAHGGAYTEFPNRPDQYRGVAWDTTLSRLFSTAITHATDRIDWYDRKATERAVVAKRIRFLSLLLFALGTLAPILLTFLIKIAAVGRRTDSMPSRWLDLIADLPLAEIGYVLLAIAGALVVFDQFFDASGSWIRFRQSQARLEVLLADFRFSWAQLMAQTEGSVVGKEPIVPFTSILRDFVIKIEWLAEDETKQWAKRFSQMIDAFDRNPNLKVSLGGTSGSDTDGGASTGAHAGQKADATSASASSTGDANREGAQTIAGAASDIASVNVRLAVDGVDTLDPGSLSLFLDDVRIDVPADGFVELAVDAGRDHTIVATARRGGQPVRAELHENVTIEDEDRALSLPI